MYRYNAKVVSIYDGDTITVEIDLGFKITSVRVCRLHGIDTPEINRGDKKAEGKLARDYLREIILGQNVVVQTYKDKTGKYGRILAKVYFDINGSGELTNINDHLVETEHAVYREY